MEIDRNWGFLPEFIIHQILSHLPPKEAAQTTLLSKTWRDSYSTSPILTFNEWFFSRSPEIVQNRLPFFDFVEKALLRYTAMNLRIDKLEITVYRVDHAPAYRILDKSLGVAFDNGVRELYVSVVATLLFSPYTLPLTMFESPKLLTYLRVDKCKFPENVVSNGECGGINFPFLKTLHLHLSYIDDGMLQKLLSSSPSLEEIVFFQVSGFKKFWVTSLGELKILDVHSSSEAVEIDIEGAQSLQVLRYLGSYIRPSLLKVGSTQYLKCLQLKWVSISDNFLKEIVAQSPLLEDLEISSCDELRKIVILSNSLKIFHFWHCKKLVEAMIYAPSLLELEYSGANVLSLSLNDTPEELKTCINIDNLGLDWLLSNEWLYQLRKLLKGVNQARVSFSLWHQNQGIEFGMLHDLRANPLPLENEIETEYFMSQINQSSSFFAAFVETIFSSSRPTTIDSCLLVPIYVEFIKFLGSELMTATRNSDCCSSDRNKCWRHYLKDIEIEVYESSQEVWQPLHQETLLTEYPFSGKKIRFSLKWYANLNAHV